MAKKLGKGEYPQGTTAADFCCSGPVAEKDTEFSQARICDMGCFNQETSDSNKYYSVCMCTHKTTGTWYVYVEYGREGVGRPQYQWFECYDENDARAQFIERCNEKNTKRGHWSKVGGIDMFVPKPGKDMYRVRVLAKRSHGLPDAQNLTGADATNGNGSTKVVNGNGKKKKAVTSYRCDDKTTKLMRDLIGGAVTYTRSTIQGGTIPVQSSIDYARSLLEAAKQRIVAVGDNVDDQVSDHDLKHITYDLYGRIPKVKPLHSPEHDWILSKDNIFGWEQDLSAFETALAAGSVDEIAVDDPMKDFRVDMEWLSPQSDVGEWLMRWWPAASRNKHSYLGKMRIHNLWKLRRWDDDKTFQKELGKVLGEMDGKKWNNERPLHQEKKRPDLDDATRKVYWDTNTALVFHGSRTVNIPGIIRTNLKLPAQLTGVVITGAMMGSGLYWADDWKKSAGYTSLSGSYWSGGSGGVKGRKAFMFVADVIMGISHVAPGPKGYTKPPAGCHSVFGKAGVTSSLANNEWIIYQNGRNILKYLCEFDTV